MQSAAFLRMMFVPKYYSGTPLNGHLSTADTRDITNNSESLRVSFRSLQCFKQPLNSGHPATRSV